MPEADAVRVAVDAHAVAQPTPGDAGNARWIENLIHALVATAGPDDSVLAMIAHDQARERIDPAVPLIEVTDRNVPRLLRGAPRVMERARADIGVFNYVVPFRGRTPSAVVVHDAAFVTNPGWFSRRDREMLGRLVPRAIKKADVVIGVSHAEAREITEIFGIDPAKVHVVRTYPAPVFTPDPVGDAANRVFARFGLRRYVLAVGDIHPRKNIGALAQAMALLGDRDLELALVGRPALGGEQIVRGANAHWLGHVTDDQLADLYRAAAVVCVPSLYEGFGLPILEAMACGASVVASNRGAMPEIAGEGAIITDPTPNALALGIREALDPANADRLGRAAAAQAAEFNETAMGEAGWAALRTGAAA
ncbi:MAG: glycosyltransferase family 4 protein [Acidobacteria bacterium]|nr:glycosyltransferase family 4 protein [Acidobacteriota bacterium]